MKWEYLRTGDMRAGKLDQLGEQGWELITIWQSEGYFKRLKDDIEVVTDITNEVYTKEFLERFYGEEETVEEAHPEEDTHQPQRCSTAGELYTAAYRPIINQDW